ncbi:fumarylacetoacetase [Granulicella sp. dw_53]|uniref:fumarylacetoacetase n=1 Tax=Granulicella sp. dw_53 TaxID=2719792 RepID=UPI001BD6DED2|nr:fumarylacetoacetase [Granulicella sp. dw_53]
MTQPPPITSLQTQSWVFGANDPTLGLGLTHLPYCAFQHPETGAPHLGAVIGACILDLHACSATGLLDESPTLAAACLTSTLNAFMALGPAAWSTLRTRLQTLLRTGVKQERKKTEAALLPLRDTTFLKPVAIPNYTDFYASIFHATRVGRLFRPDHPLLPNYKHVPIGYHGRTSSLILSGTPVTRPYGQSKPDPSHPDIPNFCPTTALDYELELGLYIGQPNPLGTPIPIDRAASHLFGVSLLNDWSARDLQSWESQPLGPFLSKNFATTLSPWITPMAALAPFRAPSLPRPTDDPQPLPYLLDPTDQQAGNLNIKLEVSLLTEAMQAKNANPFTLSRSNSSDLYWTPAQLIAHHTSNGCNLQIGDLLGTGTISGPSEDSAGCLLELTRNGAIPLTLPNGETRTFLADGDELILRAYCTSPNHPPITLGECRTTILPPNPNPNKPTNLPNKKTPNISRNHP